MLAAALIDPSPNQLRPGLPSRAQLPPHYEPPGRPKLWGQDLPHGARDHVRARVKPACIPVEQEVPRGVLVRGGPEFEGLRGDRSMGPTWEPSGLHPSSQGEGLWGGRAARGAAGGWRKTAAGGGRGTKPANPHATSGWAAEGQG
eukprot:12594158-Alexandrium_andersonii.AAC.1